MQMRTSKSTSYIHDGVSMFKFRNDPFILGDYKHNQLETMSLLFNKWLTGTPYPYQNRLFGYAAVSRPAKTFILGGCCDNNWSLISLFNDDGWSKHGHLKQGRMNSLVLSYQTSVMIVGGISKDQAS